MKLGVMSRIDLGAGSKKARGTDDSADGPSKSVPNRSEPQVRASPMQTGEPVGMLGWVVASVSVLVGFVIIAGATRIGGQRADNRGANSSIPQQTRMTVSSINPIPRKHVIRAEQNQNAVSARQQSSLSEENETLRGKNVRKALPVEVGPGVPAKQATPKPSN
jgi:hypothetical protein